ncbi:MAG: TraR/DksA family transcriptional regulator [Gemmatimonadota bacterium]
MPLTPEQREELGALLERERRKLVRRLRRFGESVDDRDLGGLSQHMAETAAEMTERETAALMASEEGRRLVEVDRALDRLARNASSFEICRSCGEEISFERLEAIPYTQLCIACKRTEESGAGR